MIDIFSPAGKYAAQGLPMFGSAVPAGFPSPADDYIEGKLDLNDYLIKHPAATFFVRVSGDSMAEAGINHGDILIVDRAVEPVNGSVVIAAVDCELTVKRLRRSKGRIFLMPENGSCKPIEVSGEINVEIWGVVTNVIHAL